MPTLKKEIVDYLLVNKDRYEFVSEFPQEELDQAVESLPIDVKVEFMKEINLARNLNSRPWRHFLWPPLLLEKWRNEREIAGIFNTVKNNVLESAKSDDRKTITGKLDELEGPFKPQTPTSIPSQPSVKGDKTNDNGVHPYP